MARADKESAVGTLTQKFTTSAGAVLTEYRGLSVAELSELRRSLGAGASYAVTKNTLTKIAAREAGHTELDELLTGPTAIAFFESDPVPVAKALRDFAKGNPNLVIKGGVLDGKPVSADQVRKLADLESREVLLAKLAGGMKGALQGAISLLAAPLSQAARAFGALQTAAAANPDLLASASPSTSAEKVEDGPAETEDSVATSDTTTDNPAAPTTGAAETE